MSGYASYSDAELARPAEVRELPVGDANDLKACGRPLYFWDSHRQPTITDLDYVQEVYQPDGRRVRCPVHLIVDPDVSAADFELWWEGDLALGRNHAVNSGQYTVGRMRDDLLLTREVNYHPESTQMVFPVSAPPKQPWWRAWSFWTRPAKPIPFYLVMGPTLDTLKVYHFDGTCGFEIAAGVWHQPGIAHPGHRVVFHDRQAKSHLCVKYDSLDSDQHWMGVRLPRE